MTSDKGEHATRTAASKPPASGFVSTHASPLTAPAAGAPPPRSARELVSKEALESRMKEGMRDLLAPITLMLGVVYVPVAFSHLVLVPGEGGAVMCALALFLALTLLAAHRWVKRHPSHLGAVPTVTSLVYVTIIVHSLARLTYARGPGDMLFVGALAVAMALLPASRSFHVMAVLSYVGGWSAIVILQDGVSGWSPYAPSLAMIVTVSIGVRHVELGRTRRVHELLLLDATREAELSSSAARLDHEVHHDALTGMPNRRLLTRRIATLFEAARESGGPEFALLHLDLDRFKVVNDSLGHDFGDKLLQGVALRLFRFIRPGDTVARLGADEFAVLLAPIDSPDEALAVAGELQSVFDGPFVIDDYEVKVAASIGIAVYADDYADAEAMIRDAGIALAEAKDSASRQRLFAADMHARALDRLKTEVDLRLAVEREELVVYYQPVVALRTGEVVGFEALLRWRHPVRGLLAPGAFLRLAEETGLIHDVGRWVLRTACRELASWDPTGKLLLSVNVSPKQFAHVDFESMVEEALHDTGLEPGRLWLELVETAVLDQPEVAEARIQRLHRLGVSIVVDDFGVGYSSLSYLLRYPFRVLKLDRLFVAPETQNEHIIEAIIRLGLALDMRVVAEGLEEPEQLETLLRLGCSLGQGYLLARPLPAEEARRLRRVELPKASAASA